MLFVHTRDAEEMRFVGERLPPPLMTFAPPDGFATFAMSRSELAKLGYRLAASSGTSFAAMCANPWTASPRTSRTRSSAPAARTRK
jgi:hypothetical protein